MNNILNYDLFIFDFDGTLFDTEKHHCKAWCNALSKEKNQIINIELSDYIKYFHSLNSMMSRNYLKVLYNIDYYDTIYKKKQYEYEKIISNENIEFINGAEDFLNFILNNNKKFIIVTNTSNKFINIFKIKYPILNKATKIYTKENFINRKPNPECYLRIAHEYKNEKKIGFEDSLIGIHALYQVSEITPILIYNFNYYYNIDIINNYNDIIILKQYNLNKLNDNLLLFNNSSNKIFIDSILNNNINQLKNNFNNMKHIISQVSALVKNISSNNQIYLSGMGKSGYVCKKSASTWQSLSIKCSYIDLPNLPHGDFGIFQDNDILILISNSGNTEEIIYILNYLKTSLNKRIITISIVANKNSTMEKLSDFTYILDNIIEADNINMTPSTSSLIFMALLDGIAINVKKNITKEEFKMVHPSGSLGKR
jgi:D-arabinose 5-phosphate isomerase GutQ/beta-phosphoglucomutase-like phosphatase (HAD superfamily)